MAKPVFTYDQAAEQLTRDLSPFYLPAGANGLTLTYAYRATANAPAVPAGATSWIGGLNPSMGGFVPFNESQITVMERTLDMIEEIANVRFVRVGTGTTGPSAYSDAAQLLIGNYTTGSAVAFGGAGQYQFRFDSNGNYVRAAKAWFNGTDPLVINASSLSKAAYLFPHEILHTIGISHPGDYDVFDGPSSYATDAVFFQDSYQYSLMSYFDETETGANWGDVAPRTPMLFDIAALQKIYGANLTTRTGDTVYGFNSNTGYDAFTFPGPTARRAFTIWDAGGNDTIDMSGLRVAATIDLREEAFSSAGVRSDGGPMINNIAIARGAIIENAIGGSSSDTLIGNSARNKFTGNGGNDNIDGSDGVDTAIFKIARVQATVSSAGSTNIVVTDTSGVSGVDTLISIERVQFTDFTLAFDLGAAQAYRIYQAAFARTPDLPGLSYWVAQMDKGLSLRDVAYGFVQSTEFKGAYGTSPTNQQLVDKLYLNVLGRPAEKAGVDYWVGLLNQGTGVVDVVAAISESGENKTNLAPIIAQGVVLETSALM